MSSSSLLLFLLLLVFALIGASASASASTDVVAATNDDGRTSAVNNDATTTVASEYEDGDDDVDVYVDDEGVDKITSSSSTSNDNGDDIIFIGTLDGTIYAVNAVTGDELWSFSTGPLLKMPAGIPSLIPDPRDGSLYTFTGAGNTGEFSSDDDDSMNRMKQLPFSVSDLVHMSPFEPQGDNIYIGHKTTHFHAVDSSTGRIYKMYSSANSISDSDDDAHCDPALPHNALYVGRAEYSVSVYDRSTGKEVWNLTFAEYASRPLSMAPTVGLLETQNEVASSDNGYSGAGASYDAAPLVFFSPQGVVITSKWKSWFGSPAIALYICRDGNLRRVPVPSALHSDSVFISQQGIDSDDFVVKEKQELDLSPAVWVDRDPNIGLYAVSGFVSRSRLDPWAERDSTGVRPVDAALSEGDGVLTKDNDYALTHYNKRLPSSFSLAPAARLTNSHQCTPAISGWPSCLLGLHSIPELRQIHITGDVNDYQNLYSRIFERSYSSMLSLFTYDGVSVGITAVVFMVIMFCVIVKHRNRSERDNVTMVKMNDNRKAGPEKIMMSPKRLGGGRKKKKKKNSIAIANANADANANRDKTNETHFENHHSSSPIVDGTFGELLQQSNDTTQIGRLKLTDRILGRGGQGTVVVEGEFDGRPVAVKRMLAEYYDLAHHEINLLQTSDYHPNVIRYFAKEVNSQFLYIVLERCASSLIDAVENGSIYESQERFVGKTSRRIVAEIGAGVAHLHALNIVHRDIKPHNVLLSSTCGRAVISDFGLCKRLADDRSSFITGSVGTRGWVAPETLINSNKKGEQRSTRSVDTFSAGLVFFYTLSGGNHPFGLHTFELEYNIRHGKSDLSALDFDAEASSLVQNMICVHPEKRPTVSSMLSHPFFWDAKKRLEFLLDVSDRLEIESADSALIAFLERDAVNVLRGTNWMKLLNKDLIENLGLYRKYNCSEVRSLMRAMRNKKNHFQDLPKNVRESLGPLPDGFLNYFSDRFPLLLQNACRTVSETELRSSEMFRHYFE